MENGAGGDSQLSVYLVLHKMTGLQTNGSASDARSPSPQKGRGRSPSPLRESFSMKRDSASGRVMMHLGKATSQYFCSVKLMDDSTKTAIGLKQTTPLQSGNDDSVSWPRPTSSFQFQISESLVIHDNGRSSSVRINVYSKHKVGRAFVGTVVLPFSDVLRAEKWSLSESFAVISLEGAPVAQMQLTLNVKSAQAVDAEGGAGWSGDASAVRSPEVQLKIVDELSSSTEDGHRMWKPMAVTVRIKEAMTLAGLGASDMRVRLSVVPANTARPPAFTSTVMLHTYHAKWQKQSFCFTCQDADSRAAIRIELFDYGKVSMGKEQATGTATVPFEHFGFQCEQWYELKNNNHITCCRALLDVEVVLLDDKPKAPRSPSSSDAQTPHSVINAEYMAGSSANPHVQLATGGPFGKMCNNFGRIEVTIVKASNIQAADLGGKSDPYVVLTIGEFTAKTSLCTKTLHPSWPDEVFSFDLWHPHGDLELKLYDWDRVSDHDILGYAAISIDTLDKPGEYEYTLWMQNPEKVAKMASKPLNPKLISHSNKHGTITVRLNVTLDKNARWRSFLQTAAVNDLPERPPENDFEAVLWGLAKDKIMLWIFSPIGAFFEALGNLMMWKSPVATVIFLSWHTFYCLYLFDYRVRVWVIGFDIFMVHHSHVWHSWFGSVPERAVEAEIEANELKSKGGKSDDDEQKSLYATFVGIRTTLCDVQHQLVTISLQIERFFYMLSWCRPEVTTVCFVVLGLLSTVLIVIDVFDLWRYAILVGGWFAFRPPFMRDDDTPPPVLLGRQLIFRSRDAEMLLRERFWQSCIADLRRPNGAGLAEPAIRTPVVPPAKTNQLQQPSNADAMAGPMDVTPPPTPPTPNGLHNRGRGPRDSPDSTPRRK